MALSRKNKTEMCMHIYHAISLFIGTTINLARCPDYKACPDYRGCPDYKACPDYKL